MYTYTAASATQKAASIASLMATSMSFSSQPERKNESLSIIVWEVASETSLIPTLLPSRASFLWRWIYCWKPTAIRERTFAWYAPDSLFMYRVFG